MTSPRSVVHSLLPASFECKSTIQGFITVDAKVKSTVLNPGCCFCPNESETESGTEKNSQSDTEYESGAQEWPRRYRIRDQTLLEPRFLLGTGIPVDL